MAGSQVNAQGITFGALGGLNYSIISVNVDPEPAGFESDNPNGLGFFLGGYGDYELRAGIKLRAELQLTFRGVSQKTEDTFEFFGTTSTTETDFKSRDTYLAIPILIDYEVNESLSLQAGPSLGFLLGSKQKGESTTTTTLAGSTSTETFSFDGSSTAGRNGFEFGIALGAQYALNETMGLGLRYTRALSDIASSNATYKQKYNVIQVLFSYKIGEK
ncbi:MAG: opacity protein-like surface antigen [Flavobacteriales bacterium]|jgi:opacity protein-like surface antigen